MLGLHVFPYDRVPGRPQGYGLEQASFDRHFTGGFRTGHRSSSSADVDNTLNYFRHRSQDALTSSATTGESSIISTSSSSSTFMEPFNGYDCGLQQQQSMLYPQYHFGAQQHRQRQHQQPAQSTLQAIPPSFGVSSYADQLQQRCLGGNAAMNQLKSSSVTPFFRSNDVDIETPVGASDTEAVGTSPLTSVSSSFDFYSHMGGGVGVTYRSAIEASYRAPSVAPISCSASAAASTFGHSISAATLSAPVTGHVPHQAAVSTPLLPTMAISASTTSPNGGVERLAKSTISVASSSVSDELAIDETTTTTMTPSSPVSRDSDQHDSTSSDFSARKAQQRRQQIERPRNRRAAVAVPADRKDSAYYERRKKNNESARRSRESRHSKEQATIDECQIARERNTKLKIQIELLQRDYNDICRTIYCKIGPTAASRFIVPPPPPAVYSYSTS